MQVPNKKFCEYSDRVTFAKVFSILKQNLLHRLNEFNCEIHTGLNLSHALCIIQVREESLTIIMQDHAVEGQSLSIIRLHFGESFTCGLT
jgi:hypothetical protein